MAFNVGAITATLGFHVDDDGATKFDRRLRTLREHTAKPVTAELRGDLNARDIELYERKLKEIRAQVARKDQFKAQLGADYNARAFNAYERDLRRAQRETDNTIRSQGRLRTAFGSVSSAGLGVFAAAGGGYAVFTGLKSIINASGEAEVSQAKLKTQLGASDISFAKHADHIDKVIQKTSQLAGLDDEDLQDAFTNIVRVTGDVNKSLRLTGLAADFARAKHIDVAKAGELVGKVAGGNIGILSRYGIQIDKGATSTEALGLLQQKFKGQAEAYGKTQKGALDRVDVAWENLRETLGKKLAPLLTDAANKLADFIAQMTEGRGAGGRFVDKLKEIGDTFKDIGGFIKDHIGLIKLAATAWLGYKAAAVAAAGASKAAALAGIAGAGGGAATGTAARIAAGAGGAAGIGAGILAVKTASDFLTDKSDLGLLDQYADKLERVIKAGDSKGMRELAGQLRETAQANNDITKGKNLHAFADALEDTAKSGGKNLDSLRDAFKRMAKSSGGDLERLRGEFADTKDKAQFNFDGVKKETRETSRQFTLMRRNTAGEMADIQDVVRRNTIRIKDRLGKDSAEGKRALADNFHEAANAVRKQMRNGEVSTREGMKAIRGYLTQELQVYGLSLRQARNILKGSAGGGRFGDPDANKGREGGAFQQRGGRVGRQGGGWLGARGMVGPDSIEVASGYWAAPGEYYAKGPGGRGAVINRHQAPLVDMALMRGGHTLDSLPRDQSALPRIEAALRDWGGLDAVFSAIQRPHMLQGGGVVSGDTDFVPAMLGALRRMAGAAGRSIFVTSGRRTLGEQQVLWDRYGHDPNRVARPSPNAPHVRGIAADISPGREVFGAMASRFGLNFRLGNEPWHIELANAMGSSVPDARPIPRSRIVGGGAVGQVVQRALDLARSGGQGLLDSASMFMPGSDAVAPAGGGHAGANKAIARRLLGAFGWGPDQFSPLDRLWTGESGWNENVVNPSSGAGGIPQALPASKMGPGWQGNPLQQIRWGLGYIKGRYGTPAAAYSAWLGRSPHWYQGGGHINVGTGTAPGHGRAHHTHHRPRHQRHSASGLGFAQDIKNMIGFAEFFENQATLAGFRTPKDKSDDLYWLRAAESTYVSLIRKLRRRNPGRAAEFVGSLEGVRSQIEELTAPAPPPDSPTTPETRPPTPEEIAQGVAGQLASFNAARASLFSTYGSNFTLAGGALIPSSATGQAAGLTHFGALTSGAGSTPAATRVIHQTNVFPTPPPEPHLFARLTLHDLQAAP